MFKNLELIRMISLILLLIGGINWGLVGIFNLNLVSSIFGIGTLITRLIYILVGLAAIYIIYGVIKKK
jgi:uncharacterized protein